MLRPGPDGVAAIVSQGEAYQGTLGTILQSWLNSRFKQEFKAIVLCSVLFISILFCHILVGVICLIFRVLSQKLVLH